MKSARGALLAAVAITLGACSTQVRSTGDFTTSLARSGEALPRPQRVVVSGFEVRPERILLDSGLAPRLQRQAGLSEAGAQQAALAEDIQRSAVDALVADLSRMGFVVDRAAPGEPLRAGDLLVDGRIVSVDQGNRTRRMVVGFGAGMSDVQATAAVSYVGVDLVPRLLQTYSAASNSGRRPGLAVGGVSSVAQGSAALGALATGLTVGGEAKRSGVAGGAQRLAHELADTLGEFFAAQGWIGPARTAALMPPRR